MSLVYLNQGSRRAPKTTDCIEWLLASPDTRAIACFSREEVERVRRIVSAKMPDLSRADLEAMVYCALFRPPPGKPRDVVIDSLDLVLHRLMSPNRLSRATTTQPVRPWKVAGSDGEDGGEEEGDGESWYRYTRGGDRIKVTCSYCADTFDSPSGDYWRTEQWISRHRTACVYSPAWWTPRRAQHDELVEHGGDIADVKSMQ